MKCVQKSKRTKMMFSLSSFIFFRAHWTKDCQSQENPKKKVGGCRSGEDLKKIFEEGQLIQARFEQEVVH